MQSCIIFPQTFWLNPDLGFAGIKKMEDILSAEKVSFKVIREYQAIIFKIKNLSAKALDLFRKNLPSDCELPALLEGNCSIISSDKVIKCDMENEKFKKLLQDSHLEVSKERKIENIPDLSVAEINHLCDNFADQEGIPIPLKEFDVEKLLSYIKIDEKFESYLGRILVDIKSNWFALDYDLLQFAKNTGKTDAARFKRFICVNNSIVRIRTIWEKLIGLAILLERPEDFDRILSAKRVRSAFIKNFKGSKHPVTRDIWDFLHSLDTFEERFRSPELHKLGRTIWWAARENPGEETNRFLAHKNDLNKLLRKIVKMFEKLQDSADKK